MARILLTGGTSFSGLWIAEALCADGHEVTAAVTREPGGYQGLRAERLSRLSASARVVWSAPVASAAFLKVLDEGWDILALHGADIPNYRSADYDVVDGFHRNIAGVEAALDAFARGGGRAVVATGTVFEAGEGGDRDGLAVSPYGLAKSLTGEAIRHLAHWRGLSFGKFVVTGPFGPLEEGRMVWSLMQAWFRGEAGVVRTPRYVRDNIPVTLLAKAYLRLCDQLAEAAGGPIQIVARPAGFVGSQEMFARLVADRMRPRLGLDCAVETWAQPTLAEPLRRANDEPWVTGDWGEGGFWDDYAAYYRRIAASGLFDAPA
jgi:nucleoside-diphosphate-sugar epimerase